MRLILASASPRRAELLREAGVQFDVDASPLDETPLENEPPAAYVERLAILKARAGLIRNPADVVLGADTTVVVDDRILGKPEHDQDAAAMLGQLSGRAHDVLTGLAVVSAHGERSVVERTTVWFKPLSETDIAAYVASGEPRDKAGAYAIQGLAARFVARLDGSYSNVVGLPVPAALRLLRETGVVDSGPFEPYSDKGPSRAPSEF